MLLLRVEIRFLGLELAGFVIVLELQERDLLVQLLDNVLHA